MKNTNFGRLVVLTLLYLALIAAAYWYFNKPKTDNSNLGPNTINSSNLNNGLANNGLANTVANNDALNPRQNGSTVTVINPPLSNAQTGIVTATNQGTINSQARQYRDNSFYANKIWRANISYPIDGDLVNSENGWVNIHGNVNVNQSRLGERLFIVVESTTQNPPMIYLQRELQLANDGFWTANVKYGSLGYEYLSYIIAAKDEAAAEAIRQLGEFTQAQLPAGVEIISKPSLNLIQ